MTDCYFADYTIGADAYESIGRVCAPLGKRALIIGGETALGKSEKKIMKIQVIIQFDLEFRRELSQHQHFRCFWQEL